MKPIRHHDIDVLARTLYGEARGEPHEGKLLVGHVIKNRWRTGYRRKETIEEVCTDPWQFSCWNENDPNRKKLMEISLADPVFRACYRAALEVVDDDYAPFPKTTRHYYAKYIDEPFWAKDHDPVMQFGVHKFYDGIA